MPGPAFWSLLLWASCALELSSTIRPSKVLDLTRLYDTVEADDAANVYSPTSFDVIVLCATTTCPGSKSRMPVEANVPGV